MTILKSESNLLHKKSFQFALKIIQFGQELQNEKKEYILSRQIIRSGTSIGANIKESEHAESRADFIYKFQIALKEANETEYWLELLFGSRLIGKDIYENLSTGIKEILKILIASIKTLKKKDLKI